MTPAADNAVPGLAGVKHLEPARPGIPDAFILTASVGGIRADTRRPAVPSVSPRWGLKHGGRFLVALYCGLVKRVSKCPVIIYRRWMPVLNSVFPFISFHF
jgi:hypothetical protein